MKAILFTVIFAAAALSVKSHAATMECRISSGAWDTNSCSHIDFSFSHKPRPAIFRIQEITKTVSQVIWKDATSSCASTATTCSIQASPYREYTGSAILLYIDGTYETVDARAYFETGF